MSVLTEEEIFAAAVQKPPSERASFLDRACAGEALLRFQVESLLRAHDGPDSLLDAPGHCATIAAAPSIKETLGTLIGPYKLLEQIGEGGMGLVYMAEQQQPVRRLVALKIIKPGFDSKQTIARFEAERQALAMMDHPNIAKVHDAGTTETGRPYFVMELVRGIPLNEFCDQKRLVVRERLQLFVQVCQAVQHAHQKGIIHRDLKPTNVLVAMADTVAFPKLLDFGIAKALGQSLTDSTLHTGYSQLVGTPLYMSPEQAEMNVFGVDTRSDVYSLGVLLYELLTGTTPFDKEQLTKASFDEMRRMIREDDPLRPSARMSTLKAQALSTISQQRNIDPRRISATLRGELDWIVMKSLEKDRSRRYESASALAADIQRYLSDETVLACPPNTMYRFQKFARKHKAAFTTAAAIAVCLILGTTVSAWQAVRASTAEAQATANEQKAVANATVAEQKEQEAIKQRDEVKALADKLAAKEEQLERTLYADHLYMAKEAWDGGNVARATSLLKQHLPNAGETDRRGFEWHYLNRLTQVGPLVSIKTGLRTNAFNVQLGPDRTRLYVFSPGRGRRQPDGTATAGTVVGTFEEPSLKVWNLQTGQEEFSAVLSKAGIKTAFSPDGTRLVTGAWLPVVNPGDHNAAGNLQLWDTKSGQELLARAGNIGPVVFSANSQLLASLWEDRTLKVIDLKTGQERWSLKGHTDNAHYLVFSADGRTLASAGITYKGNTGIYVASDIKVWDLQTGEELWGASGISERLSSLAFSPDGQHLTGAQGAVKLWNAQTGESLKSFPFDNIVDSELVFSPDGTRLICNGSKFEQFDSVRYTKMWNVQSGQELLSFKNGALYFSPDGKRVAAEDQVRSRTKVFDALTAQQVMNIPGTRTIFSPDSKRLAAVRSEGLRSWDVQTGLAWQGERGQLSQGLRVWDLQTGDEINHIKADILGDRNVAFSLDGKRLIGNSPNFETHIWEVEAKPENSKAITFHGLNRQGSPRGPIAVFSADLTRVAGISFGLVMIFDGTNGRELRILGPFANLSSIAITPDGKRVAGSTWFPGAAANTKPGVVKIWDADTSYELHAIKGQARSIDYLAFSPDGKKLAGMANDRTVKIWDTQSGGELHTLGNKTSGPIPNPRLAFSPDSKSLMAAGKKWDVETGTEIANFKGTVQDCISFSPDGKRFVGGVRGAVVDAQTGEVLFNLFPTGFQTGYPWLTFSPDGKRLASNEGIWDAQTGQELLSFGNGRNSYSSQVFFSPDGHRLAVVPFNGNEVTIYDATPLPEKP